MTHLWDDVPGFGTIVPMAKKAIAALSNEGIAHRLRLLWRVSGIKTASGFADTNGWSPQQLNNYLNTSQRISVDAAYQLCQRWRVTLDWIYLGNMAMLPAELIADLQRAEREIEDE